MAENKKSFLLYCDLIHTVSQMPNDKAGELFKHILEYVNDKNPNSEDLLIKLTFEPIKQSLKRDLVKYENIINRNKVNGLKGGRPQKPKEPIGLIGNPTKPKKADSDSDSDIVNDKDIKEKYFDSFWNLYNKKIDSSKCKSLFLKLSDSEIELILNSVSFYIKNTPDVKFRKNPLTWLNGKCWNDEILTTDKKFKCEFKNHIGKIEKTFTENEILEFTKSGFYTLSSKNEI
jgi:hypothetical protein